MDSGGAPAKNVFVEIAQQIKKNVRAIKQEPDEIAEMAERVKKRQAEIRRHIEDANARIRRGIRPVGEKFRL